MPPWQRLSYNQQIEILLSEEKFREFVCDRLDTGLTNFGQSFNFLLWLSIIQTVLMGIILWRVW